METLGIYIAWHLRLLATEDEVVAMTGISIACRVYRRLLVINVVY